MTNEKLLTGLNEIHRLIQAGASDSALTIVNAMIKEAMPTPKPPFDDEAFDIVYKEP
jgi:hypothetical protein